MRGMRGDAFVGNFLKEVPHTLQELLNRRNRKVAYDKVGTCNPQAILFLF
jgi:hypothetical protein